MSTLDEIKKLEQQKQALIEKAKKELLSEIEASVKSLNELGFNYSLVENAPKKRKRRTKKEMEG